MSTKKQKKKTRRNPGKMFEEDFRNSVPDDVKCDRLADPSVSFAYGQNKDKNIKDNPIRFSKQNPYDFILYRRPKQICLELKSTQGTSFQYKGKSRTIKKHQIQGLIDASKYCDAGFLLNFRRTETTYYLPIQAFIELTDNMEKMSINEKDVARCAIIIPSKKKITRYTYDINALFDSCR